MTGDSSASGRVLERASREGRAFLRVESSCEQAAWTPDGLVVTPSETLDFWDPRDRSLSHSFARTEGGEFRAIASSPVDDCVAVGRFSTRDVDLVRADGTVLRSLPHEEWTRSIAFSPDGRLVVTGGGPQYHGKPDPVVRVWDVASGELRWSLKGLRASVAAVAFSRDGTRVAAAAKTTVRVWTLFEQGKAKKRPSAPFKLPQGDEVTTLAFAEDGDLLVAAGRTVRKVEPASRSVRWERSWDRMQVVACDAMAWTPAGVLATVVDEIVLLDHETGADRWQARGPKGLRFLAADTLGTHFVAVGLDSRKQLRSVETGAELR